MEQSLLDVTYFWKSRQAGLLHESETMEVFRNQLVYSTMLIEAA